MWLAGLCPLVTELGVEWLQSVRRGVQWVLRLDSVWTLTPRCFQCVDRRGVFHLDVGTGLSIWQYEIRIKSAVSCGREGGCHCTVSTVTVHYVRISAISNDCILSVTIMWCGVRVVMSASGVGGRCMLVGRLMIMWVASTHSIAVCVCVCVCVKTKEPSYTTSFTRDHSPLVSDIHLFVPLPPEGVHNETCCHDNHHHHDDHDGHHCSDHTSIVPSLSASRWSWSEGERALVV